MSSVPSVTSNEGVALPAIVYGTAWKKERTAALVQQAVTAGFRGIDTACQPKHYNEAGVGEALQVLAREGVTRESLYLQTKFTPVTGQDPDNMPYDPERPLAEQVARSFEVSKRNLDTDYLDALILHSPIAPFESTLEAWGAMEDVYAAGEARQLGISNCYDLPVLQALYQSARVKPAIVQNRFYQATDYDRALRTWCREHGVIYQSFWTLTANPHVLSATAVAELAAKYRCEPAQILLRFVTQSDIVPLTGTTSETHMRDDLAMFAFSLTESELRDVALCLTSTA